MRRYRTRQTDWGNENMLTHEQMTNAALDKLERRALFRKAGTGVAGAIATAALVGTTFGSIPAKAGSVVYPSTAAPTQTDVDVLTFALNLEYLEAQFYLNALIGTGLSANDLAGGTSTNGVYNTPGATPVAAGTTLVPFATPIIRQLAQTIAADEQAHVRFLKTALTSLGASPVPAPVIDVSAAGAFTTLAVAAGLIQNGQIFNPYQDENAFLLGAFIFEDVGVTAYGGAAGLISMGSELIQYAASILAVEAYHAGTIRALLTIRGGGAATNAVANLRSILSSGVGQGATGSDDFGTFDTVNNVVMLAPLDANALTYRRTTSQVLNIVYGNSTKTPGLFFPNGMNGNIK